MNQRPLFFFLAIFAIFVIPLKAEHDSKLYQSFDDIDMSNEDLLALFDREAHDLFGKTLEKKDFAEKYVELFSFNPDEVYQVIYTSNEEALAAATKVLRENLQNVFTKPDLLYKPLFDILCNSFFTQNHKRNNDVVEEKVNIFEPYPMDAWVKLIAENVQRTITTYTINTELFNQYTGKLTTTLSTLYKLAETRFNDLYFNEHKIDAVTDCVIDITLSYCMNKSPDANVMQTRVIEAGLTDGYDPVIKKSSLGAMWNNYLFNLEKLADADKCKAFIKSTYSKYIVTVNQRFPQLSYELKIALFDSHAGAWKDFIGAASELEFSLMNYKWKKEKLSWAFRPIGDGKEIMRSVLYKLHALADAYLTNSMDKLLDRTSIEDLIKNMDFIFIDSKKTLDLVGVRLPSLVFANTVNDRDFEVYNSMFTAFMYLITENAPESDLVMQFDKFLDVSRDRKLKLGTTVVDMKKYYVLDKLMNSKELTQNLKSITFPDILNYVPDAVEYLKTHRPSKPSDYIESMGATIYKSDDPEYSYLNELNNKSLSGEDVKKFLKVNVKSKVLI